MIGCQDWWVTLGVCGGGVTRLSLGCHQLHVLLLPRLLLIIPPSSLLTLATQSFSLPLTLPRLPEPTQVTITCSFSRSCRLGKAAKKGRVSAVDGAGVVAGLLLVVSSAGAGGAGQWPTRA